MQLDSRVAGGGMLGVQVSHKMRGFRTRPPAKRLSRVSLLLKSSEVPGTHLCTQRLVEGDKRRTGSNAEHLTTLPTPNHLECGAYRPIFTK